MSQTAHNGIIFLSALATIGICIALGFDWFGNEQTVEEKISAVKFRVVKAFDKDLTWHYFVEYKRWYLISRWRRLRGSTNTDQARVIDRYLLLAANKGNHEVVGAKTA